MPHGLTRSGSVRVASPGTLETRLVCAYWALAGAEKPSAASERAAAAEALWASEESKEGEVRFTSVLHRGSGVHRVGRRMPRRRHRRPCTVNARTGPDGSMPAVRGRRLGC